MFSSCPSLTRHNSNKSEQGFPHTHFFLNGRETDKSMDLEEVFKLKLQGNFEFLYLTNTNKKIFQSNTGYIMLYY